MHLSSQLNLAGTNELTYSSIFPPQAVDVVGQAGKPKTITGFQTHTTPVLLAYGERAELATEECILFLKLGFYFCISPCCDAFILGNMKIYFDGLMQKDITPVH